MSMGMTPEQFWDGDYEYAKHYKKAFELRRELENEAMWIQGMYFCDAVLHALHGRKAKYPLEPYSLKTEISKKREEAKQEQNERKVVDYMMTFTEQFNKRFAQKQNEKGDAT